MRECSALPWIFPLDEIKQSILQEFLTAVFWCVFFSLDLKELSLRSELFRNKSFCFMLQVFLHPLQWFLCPRTFTLWGKKDEKCDFFGKMESFLKRWQGRNIDPPQTSSRLIAGENIIEVHNQENDSLKAIHAWAPSGELLCIPQIEGFCLDKGSASLWTKSVLLSAFVNKILLECCHVHWLTYCLWLHLHHNGRTE